MKNLFILLYYCVIDGTTAYNEDGYMGCYESEDQLSTMFDVYFGKCEFSIDKTVGKVDSDGNTEGVISVYVEKDKSTHCFFISKATPGRV